MCAAFSTYLSLSLYFILSVHVIYNIEIMCENIIHVHNTNETVCYLELAMSNFFSLQALFIGWMNASESSVQPADQPPQPIHSCATVNSTEPSNKYQKRWNHTLFYFIFFSPVFHARLRFTHNIQTWAFKLWNIAKITPTINNNLFTYFSFLPRVRYMWLIAV